MWRCIQILTDGERVFKCRDSDIIGNTGLAYCDSMIRRRLPISNARDMVGRFRSALITDKCLSTQSWCSSSKLPNSIFPSPFSAGR